MRVLIVDDNASMRTMLAALLGSQGYEIVGSLGDGNGIMQTITEKSPEIVCLDYQLPGRNGLDILREIHESLPDVDVVFMTASEDVAIEHQAADAGAAGFLRKPFGQSQIISEMKQVGDARRQARSANATAAAETPAPAAGSPASAYDPLSVIIADDNGSIRLLLKGILSGLGLNVVQTVVNGEEAVAAARNHQPGVLCLDVNMPIMSGLEALPQIREASPQTAVVMVTGNASREFVEKAAALGARGYIVKPIRPAYIETFIRKLVKL
jgi:DNA-binding NarL/FixJ family response regulator